MIVAGRANLAEIRSSRQRVSCAALRLRSRRQGAAGVAPRQRRRRDARSGCSPGRRTASTRSRSLDAAAAARSSASCCSAADPLADFPDTDLARRGWPVRRGSSPSTRSSPSRAQSRRRRAGRRGLRREVAARRPTSRAASRRCRQKVTPRGTSRPDWMIAAELAMLLGHRPRRSTSVDDVTDGDRRQRRRLRRRDGRRAAHAHRDGIVCNGTLPTVRPTQPGDVDARNSYDYRLVVSRKLYDNAVGTAMSPSLAHLAIGLRRCTCTRSTSSGSASTDGADVKVTSKRSLDGAQGRRRRRGVARHRRGCRSTSRGRASVS